MNYLMMNQHNLVRSPADEGSGGGDGTSDEAEGDAGDDGAGEQDFWLDSVEDVDDSIKAYVGDRSLTDVLKLGIQHRTKLSQRVDEHAKNEGLVRPLAKDADDDAVHEHIKALRPDDKAEYLTSVGIKPDEATVKDNLEAEAAFEAGLPKVAFRKFKEKLKLDEEEANKSAGEEIGHALAQEWGADAERNQQVISRAVSQIGLQEFMDAFPQPSDGVPSKSYIALMNGMLKMGERLLEGGAIPDDPGGSGGRNLTDQRSDLEYRISEMRDTGKIVPESDVERLRTLNHKIAEEKTNAAA